MLSRSTRTAEVRRSRIAQTSDDTFSLSHMCCFDSARCGCVCHHYVFKSFPAFRGVSLSRHRQSGAVNFANWTSCHVTKLFEVCFTDVDIAGSLVVTVIRFGRSRVNVWQLWDDQQWLRQIFRNIAWVRLPGRSTHILQQSLWSHRCSSGNRLTG